MKNKRVLFLILACLVLITGCFQGPIKDPIQITKYYPKIENAKESPSFLHDFGIYEVYNGPDYTINSSIYNINSGVIVFLEITNNTNQEIPTTNYYLKLTDGRDLRPIKMLDRSDLVNLRSRLLTGVSGSLQDQLIQNTMTSAMKIVDLPTQDKIKDTLTLGINNYFGFRPIYPNYTRKGLICFMPDFNLEFPLNLTIKIQNKTFEVQYLPNK